MAADRGFKLARLAKHTLSEQACVAACRELLDRAYGKASQPVDAQVKLGISAELQEILQRCDGRSRSIPKANATLLLTDSIPTS